MNKTFKQVSEHYQALQEFREKLDKAQLQGPLEEVNVALTLDEAFTYDRALNYAMELIENMNIEDGIKAEK